MNTLAEKIDDRLVRLAEQHPEAAEWILDHLEWVLDHVDDAITYINGWRFLAADTALDKFGELVSWTSDAHSDTAGLIRRIRDEYERWPSTSFTMICRQQIKNLRLRRQYRRHGNRPTLVRSSAA